MDVPVDAPVLHIVVKTAWIAAEVVVGENVGVARCRHEGSHLGGNWRDIAGRNDVVGRDAVLHRLERCAGAYVADACVAGRVKDQRLVIRAGPGKTAATYATIELGEVALNHQRGWNCEERGISGAARVELVIGEEEEDFFASMGDVATEGE